MSSSPPPAKRRYVSTRRERQAAQTRADVLRAAIEMFGEFGWAKTTLSALAERADVAVETIYGGFGSKKGLLLAAMNVAIVGDADEIPFVEREEFRRLGDGNLDERLRWMSTLLAEIHERSAPVWSAVMEAAAADADVDASRVDLELGRRVDVGRSLSVVLGRPVDGAMVDMIWAIFGPEVYLKLTRDAGLPRSAYEQLVTEAVRRLLVDRPQPDVRS